MVLLVNTLIILLRFQILLWKTNELLQLLQLPLLFDLIIGSNISDGILGRAFDTQGATVVFTYFVLVLYPLHIKFTL